MKPIYLGGNRLVRDDPVSDVRDFPDQQMHRAYDDAGRCRHPDEFSFGNHALGRHLFPEPIGNQCRERIERRVFVVTLSTKQNR